MRNALPKAALALVLIAQALPAAAQQANWRRGSSAGGQSVLIDTTSIQRDGDKVRFMRELRLRETRQLEGGASYDRIGALMEADCRGRTLRALEIAAKMGETTVFSGEGDGEADPARPGSTADIDLRAVCFNEWPG